MPARKNSFGLRMEKVGIIIGIIIAILFGVAGIGVGIAGATGAFCPSWPPQGFTNCLNKNGTPSSKCSSRGFDATIAEMPNNNLDEQITLFENCNKAGGAICSGYTGGDSSGRNKKHSFHCDSTATCSHCKLKKLRTLSNELSLYRSMDISHLTEKEQDRYAKVMKQLSRFPPNTKICTLPPRDERKNSRLTDHQKALLRAEEPKARASARP